MGIAAWGSPDTELDRRPHALVVASLEDMADWAWGEVGTVQSTLASASACWEAASDWWTLCPEQVRLDMHCTLACTSYLRDVMAHVSMRSIATHVCQYS